jgi:hypothetical protein
MRVPGDLAGHARALAEALPNGRYTELPGDHFTAMTSPKFEEALFGFLTGLRACNNAGMSPKSRGRPVDRRGRKRRGQRPAARSRGPLSLVPPDADEATFQSGKTTCWFDEPDPGDRRSWAIPAGHGTYQELDLELLNPDDENELIMLMEARHPEFEDALERGEEMIIDGEPFNPRLHVTMHQVVANQLLADDPPETWQTVQRLARLGYDWHNIMHMIAALVIEDVHRSLAEHLPFDADDYVRRLNALPGDWPAPLA